MSGNSRTVSPRYVDGSHSSPLSRVMKAVVLLVAAQMVAVSCSETANKHQSHSPLTIQELADELNSAAAAKRAAVSSFMVRQFGAPGVALGSGANGAGVGGGYRRFLRSSEPFRRFLRSPAYTPAMGVDDAMWYEALVAGNGAGMEKREQGVHGGADKRMSTYGWEQCEFSPLSCLIRRRRK